MSTKVEGQLSKSTAPVEKAEGALLALAAGDALGWPRSFRTTGVASPRARLHMWSSNVGYGVAAAASNLFRGDHQRWRLQRRYAADAGDCALPNGPRHRWWKAFTRVELPMWTVYERGGGGATKAARRSLGQTPAPWRSNKEARTRQYFEAGGNGVAMRVLPHALFYSQQDGPTKLLHDVVLDGTATHGHPRALLGATAYAYAAWSLVRRTTTLGFGELLDTLIDEVPEWGEFPRSEKNGGSWFERRNMPRTRATNRSGSKPHAKCASCLRRHDEDFRPVPSPTTTRF